MLLVLMIAKGRRCARIGPWTPAWSSMRTAHSEPSNVVHVSQFNNAVGGVGWGGCGENPPGERGVVRQQHYRDQTRSSIKVRQTRLCRDLYGKLNQCEM